MRLVRIVEVVRIESTVFNKSRKNAVIETAFAAVGGKLICSCNWRLGEIRLRAAMGSELIACVELSRSRGSA